MKVRDLIKRLLDTPMDSTVFIQTEENFYDFTGFSIDDLNDVQLYVAIGDKEA